MVRSGNVKGARDQFAVFRYATLTSPDLLFADAQRIVDDAEKELEAALQTTETARAGEIELQPLENLRPFCRLAPLASPLWPRKPPEMAAPNHPSDHAVAAARSRSVQSSP